MLLRHPVGVVVVVDQRGVFVWSGHIIDAERTGTALIEMPDLQPDACGLNQHFRAGVGEETAVVAGFDVQLDRERDGGVDVILRRTARVMCRAFVTADRAPWIQRATRMIHLAGVGARAIERVQAKEQARLDQRRCGKRERGQHEGFRIPEHMAFVALAGQALRGDAAISVARRGLKDVEQVELQCLFAAPVMVDRKAGAFPEHGAIARLGPQQRVETFVDGAG